MPLPQHPLKSFRKPLAVVIADDVLEIQNLVHLWLTEAGCNVDRASSGNEVIRMLREKAFDIIITDVIMPNGDGVEVIAEAKRVQPNARVLAISGGGHHLKAMDCLKIAKGLGANAVLLKPFNRDQLLAEVMKLATVRSSAPIAGGKSGA
jgi:CheY-like chemotaxis protein